jgi:hypothetical protein
MCVRRVAGHRVFLYSHRINVGDDDEHEHSTKHATAV